MNDDKWAKFFSLVQDILDMPGTWQEKEQVLKQQAEVHGQMANLQELCSWITE